MFRNNVLIFLLNEHPLAMLVFLCNKTSPFHLNELVLRLKAISRFLSVRRPRR